MNDWTPAILQKLNNDEYIAPEYTAEQGRAVARVEQESATDAPRARRSRESYRVSRLGTAAGLLAINDEYEGPYFQVPPEAKLDIEAADFALGGDQLVIDVQTHFKADRDYSNMRLHAAREIYREWAPDWWVGMNTLEYQGFSEYMRCIFLESETDLAVLTSMPPDMDGVTILNNEEMAVTRQLIERVGGAGRLLSHVVVHPTEPGAIGRMAEWRDAYRPVAWKVYTTGKHAGVAARERGVPRDVASAWMLDDERYGLPFLDRAHSLGVRNVCLHKGLSNLVDNGSPRDIGPCARLYPDMNFIVYHSGFEVLSEEGPYSEETREVGANRLISSLIDADVPRAENVFAELGSTWFCVIKRPLEAAHLLGKLLLALGEDNILWGTDGIWYGTTQEALDAFRAFQIPDQLCADYGYPKLTPEIKRKILADNAARLYGIDLEALRQRVATDDLAWARSAIAEYRRQQKPE
jgi:predicted TIM-barrel fold metal-dependent hydrolase